MSKSRILLICVDYRTGALSADFARSMLEAEPDTSTDLALIIIDNSGGTTPSPDLCAAGQDPRVTVLSPGANLGYFGGAARALDTYTAEHGLPDWVVVSNPDIRIEQPDLFDALMELHGRGDSAVIAPRILGGRAGRDQNPFLVKRPGRRRMAFYKLAYRTYPGLLIYQLLARLASSVLHLVRPRPAGANGGTRRIYAAHGSFLVFHRSYFERGGHLHRRAFLFGEEIFVAESCRQLGLHITYDPRLAVRHLKHASTGLLRSRRIAAFEREAAAVNYDRYFAE